MLKIGIAEHSQGVSSSDFDRGARQEGLLLGAPLLIFPLLALLDRATKGMAVLPNITMTTFHHDHQFPYLLALTRVVGPVAMVTKRWQQSPPLVLLVRTESAEPSARGDSRPETTGARLWASFSSGGCGTGERFSWCAVPWAFLDLCCCLCGSVCSDLSFHVLSWSVLSILL